MGLMTLQDTLEERRKDPPAPAEAVERKYGTPAPYARLGNGVLYQKYYEDETTSWCQGVRSAAGQQQGEDPSLQDISKWIRVLSGDHWLQGRPSYRATPVLNLSLRYWRELQSIISDVRLSTFVHSDNPEYKQIAENITKLSAANWQNRDGDVTLMDTVQHSSFGLGYTKIGMNTDEMSPQFLACGADTITPILPNRNDYQLSGGTIYECWKPLSWFYDKFSIVAREITPESTGWTRSFASRPFYIPEYTWNNMNPGLRNVIAANTDDKAVSITEAGRVPMAKMNEFWFHDAQINESKERIRVGYGNFQYWVKPGFPIYPFGRLICTGGEDCKVTLYDGPNFHWHGQQPFDPLRLMPVVWMFSGMSVLKDTFPINQTINQLLADFQDYLKQLLNPTLIVKEGAMSEDAWDEYFPGMPGAKIRLLNRNMEIAQMMKFERVDPGGLGIVPQAIQMMTRFFYEQAGMTDTGQLTNKKQMPSEGTIEQIQNIKQSLFRLMARMVEVHMRHIGVMQISDIIQFTTRKAAYSYLGPDGVTWQNFDFDPDSYVPQKGGSAQESPLAQAQRSDEPFRRGREFVKNFKQMVTSGTALPAQRQAMANIAQGLNARGKMSTESMYGFMSQAGYPMPVWAEEETRIIAEGQKLPQAKPSKGAGGKQPKQ
jgi:hypothetical protein